MSEDAALLYFVVAVIMAVLGLVAHEAFFCFHLLRIIVPRNRTLAQVMRAVTTNGDQLLVVCASCFITLYFLAVWGFYSMPEEANWLRDGSCYSIITCFSSLLTTLAEGHLGSYLQSVTLRGHPVGMFLNRLAYHFLFFVIIVTIQLNMIFGIIIDTFGELRGKQAAKLYNMRNTCFICGIDRFSFETRGVTTGVEQGGGFERHIRDDHNIWAYLGLMVHVSEKLPHSYNGWEQHVAEKITKNDASFLPRNTAIVLQAFEEREGAALQSIDKRMALLSEETQAMRRELADALTRIAPTEGPLSPLVDVSAMARAGSASSSKRNHEVEQVEAAESRAAETDVEKEGVDWS